jgi:leucyl aminopeptidase (aminopeptidase T)
MGERLRAGMAAPEPTERSRSKVAHAVLTKNLAVRPGERVIIEGWTHTLPWSVAFLREARRLGAEAIVLYEDESAYWDSVEGGEAARIGTVGAHEWAALRRSDVYVHMWGPGDRVRLNALPAKVRNQLFGFNEEWYRVARREKIRGARLEVGRPHPALAAAYGVKESSWLDQVIRATLVDPARLAKAAAPVARALGRGKRLRIHDERGTDLTLGLARRRVRSFTGTVLPAAERGPYDNLVNLPAGVTAVALDEKVADGTLVANRTNYYDDGKATGAVFHFSRGKLTEATFDKGQERFDEPYRTGGRGRDRPGMLRIGLNPELHDTPQLEDVERGAVMVSVGGNRAIGGTNGSSFFGWAINAGAEIEVDGRPVPL